MREAVVDPTSLEGLEALGIDGILMDTGAGPTLIPMSLATSLGIEEPACDSDRWVITMGLGGINVGYLPEEPVTLIVEGQYGDRIEADIPPVVYLGCAPIFTAVAEHLAVFDNHRFPRSIVDFVTVPYQMEGDGYAARVSAPDLVCKILGRRPKLADPAAVPKLRLVIIGRDWQRSFRVQFRERDIRIDV